MVRTALWLVTEIGEGNVFTKEQHRGAFPGVSQADRRMRGLRDYGWVIHTSSDDVTLRPEEQRFVKAGLPVWKPGVRQSAAAKTITAKQRQAIFAADEYQCVVCGVAGGESYVDSPNETAVLAVTRRQVRLPGGEIEEQLITECKRCRSGMQEGEFGDVRRILSDIRDLDEADRKRLSRWIERGRRGPTALDRAWTSYRRLPADARAALAKELSG
ncbi:hypothetical protein [Nonomuraea sp. NPDC023979]|uniref:hypothetical protein n=1 Tax=Nonomuraea sp. NPDC023979 TaxID=3154796 RepID=UPI0033CF8784